MTATYPSKKDNSSAGGSTIPNVPYRGLEPFRYVDSEIFFGRGKEVRKLSRYITMYRAVLIYGESGTGKSSLINASLIPELIGEGYISNRIRVQPRSNEEIIVERIQTTESPAGPFLPSSFEMSGDEPRIVISASSLKERLRQMPADKYPLLIFDQFEELVTLFEEASLTKVASDSLRLQEKIIDVLVDLIGDHSLRVKLLFVFREDYLAKLNKFSSRCPDITDNFVRLTSPEKSSLLGIIRGPFKKFPGRYENEITESLAEDLTNKISASSESETINPSEVQIACLRLWQSKNPAELLARRKVEGILEDFLTDSLKSLPEPLLSPAVSLLRRMVMGSGTRNVISEEDLIELTHREERIPVERLKTALKSLVENTRLVRRERRQDIISYQIVSEFLVPWIRRQKAEQQARQSRRRTYRVIVLSGIVTIVALSIAYSVNRYRTTVALRDEYVRMAQRQAESAESRAEQSEKEKSQLKALLAADTSKAQINEILGERDRALKDRDRFQNESGIQAQEIKELGQNIVDRDVTIKQSQQKLYDQNVQITDLTKKLNAAEAEIKKTAAERDGFKNERDVITKDLNDGKKNTPAIIPNPGINNNRGSTVIAFMNGDAQTITVNDLKDPRTKITMSFLSSKMKPALKFQIAITRSDSPDKPVIIRFDSVKTDHLEDRKPYKIGDTGYSFIVEQVLLRLKDVAVLSVIPQ